MKLPAALLLALIASASAQTIQKWKTPDGKLFFGANPPAGSVPEGEVGSLGTASSPEMSQEFDAARERAKAEDEEAKVVEEPEPAEPVMVEKWIEAPNCPVTIRFTNTAGNRNWSRQYYGGWVDVGGKDRVRGVKVCDSDSCALVRDGMPMDPGETAEFSGTLWRGETSRLSTRCEILQMVRERKPSQ